MMRVLRGLPKMPPRRRLCLAMGVFDGVHLGHRAIIAAAVESARRRGRGAAPALLTFEPHPEAVLSPTGAPPLLTTTEEKLSLVRGLGVEMVIILEFTRSLADTSAEEFTREVLGQRLRAGYAVVGEGWRFGAGGKGDLRLLQRVGREVGLHVRGVKRVRRRGEPVSSTRIRRLLQKGGVRAAGALLGRPYQLRGEVVSGDRRGRTLGFPTANLRLPAEKLIPADGVYACLAGLRKLRPAVASIGVRPTFERDGERRVEVHLLDIPRPRELLGRILTVQLIARVRGERKFSSAEALISQMKADCRQARRVLARRTTAGR